MKEWGGATRLKTSLTMKLVYKTSHCTSFGNMGVFAMELSDMEPFEVALLEQTFFNFKMT